MENQDNGNTPPQDRVEYLNALDDSNQFLPEYNAWKFHPDTQPEERWKKWEADANRLEELTGTPLEALEHDLLTEVKWLSPEHGWEACEIVNRYIKRSLPTEKRYILDCMHH